MPPIPRRQAILIALATAAIATLATTACERPPAPRQPGPVRVVVTVAPLVSVVRALTGPDAEVTALIPPGRSVHGYEPTPTDLAAIGRADLAVTVGLGLDSAIARRLSRGRSTRPEVLEFAAAVGLEGDDDHDHHGHGHDHPDHAIDPHLWLDPPLMEQLVPNLRAGIERSLAAAGLLDDAERARLDAAERELLSMIQDVDVRYTERLAPLRGRAIVTHHDAFRRIADRYGLRIAAVIRPVESGEPTPGAIAAAVDAIRKEGARAVFFEPQFDPAAAERIARAAGVRLGRLDPEGGTDWPALMNENLDSLVTNLGD